MTNSPKHSSGISSRWNIKIEDMEFNERIGKGNFGEVWKGNYLGLEVAIKKLFFVDDDFMTKYIEREMETLRGLSHPNIVQLIGLCSDHGDVYIITEFVPGGSLRQLLKNPNIHIPWSRRLGFARDVALAMNYLHHKDIMHRDLKSANLLVGADWRLKVCDFGLARKSPDGEERQITTVGTNEWMAPEVAMQEVYDKSADVFSFGLVIYELITRMKPPKRSLKTRFEFDQTKIPDNLIPADMPEELWNLMCECTDMNPDERPSFSKILAELKGMTITETAEADIDEIAESSSMATSDLAIQIVEVTIDNPKKAQQTAIKCIIPLQEEWAAQSVLPIQVHIDNTASGKAIKTIRYWVQTEPAAGKRTKVTKSKVITFKGQNTNNGSFPVKPGQMWEGTFPFQLPATIISTNNKRNNNNSNNNNTTPQHVTHQVHIEVRESGGLVGGGKRAVAVFPITVAL